MTDTTRDAGFAEVDTVVLYRPTGPDELRLLQESGMKRWPPRLPGQPIFFPVTNEEYAISERSVETCPTRIRTLDALHLTSIEFLRSRKSVIPIEDV